MSLPFLSPSRTVLLLSDSAVHVYYKNKKVTSIPWEQPDFEKALSEVVVKKCRKAPVLFINDMVEQHYRKEKLPRVQSFDKANMIKRKLAISFPNYPVRAALPLKEKPRQVENARIKADNYIFAALPSSEQFHKSLGAVQNSLNTISGYTLLPVESSVLVNKLSTQILRNQKAKEKPVWRVFMGQHEGGGLRQIVTRNGDLALTRMSPIVSDQADKGDWVAEVAKEFQSTMSYLSRFGYNPKDGMHIITIADTSYQDALADAFKTECIFSVLNARDAAKMLSLPKVESDNDFYADGLHIGWIGSRSKFVLPMQSDDVEKISRPRQAAAFAMFLLLLSGAFQGYQIFNLQSQLDETVGNLENQTRLNRRLDGEYQIELEKQGALGLDFLLVRASVNLSDALIKADPELTEVFYHLGQALEDDRRIDGIEIERDEIDNEDGPNVFNDFGFVEDANTEEAIVGDPYKISITIQYPPDINVDVGNSELRRIANLLDEKLPDYEVGVEKFIRDFAFIDDLVVGREEEEVQQDFVTSITIQGPIIEEEDMQ